MNHQPLPLERARALRAVGSAALGGAGLGAAHLLSACGGGCSACGLCIGLPLAAGALLLLGAAAESVSLLRSGRNLGRIRPAGSRPFGSAHLAWVGMGLALLQALTAGEALAGRPPAGEQPLTLAPAPSKKGPPGRPAMESEHRPLPFRAYRASDPGLAEDAQALVRRPDGSLEPARIQRDGEGVSVAFPTPMGDGPAHGPNNLYLVETRDGDGGTRIRVAKWTTVHHNCGWGHAFKFDPARRNPGPVDSVPLEVVGTDLLDGNFHSRTASGDLLHLQVYSYGKPAAGARLRVITARGWSREVFTDATGGAEVQLVRDYYPPGWDEFHAAHRDPLTIVADYTWQQDGQPVRATTSLKWHYTPAERDYSSYSAGLSLGAGGLLATLAGVFVYRERRTRPPREEWPRETD